MARHTVEVKVRGPWSLATSRQFWEEFTPFALPVAATPTEALSATFRVDTDWSVATAEITQHATGATIAVDGDGDLDGAVAQVARMLALDVDGSGWPSVGERDAVIADAQARLPGMRPCGFHSPYEAAAWSVLSQRIRIVQAARLRERLVTDHGDHGAFPAPDRLRRLDLDLPGRKTEYLRAIAEAALDGRLDGAMLHAADPERSVRELQAIKGVGPFAAELIVLRGANVPDGLPANDRRLQAEIVERYGAERTLEQIAQAWRPYRTWAAVHLRALREQRTHEISGNGAQPTAG